MNELIIKYKNNEISLRSLIAKIKANSEYVSYIYNQTAFLDRYNADILERIYCVLHNITDIVKCKYCDHKAKWSGRINDGYKLTCCSKECESKRISEQKTGISVISKNRDTQFIEWQTSIQEVNDNIVREYIKYDKYIPLITNPVIISYLNNRYTDSSSLLETVNRIKLEIEEKPKCPICGNPVTFVGKPSKMFTKYCSTTCAGKSEETISKKKQTQLENWGTANCYDSEKYRKYYKEKYGVEYISQRKDVIEKRNKAYLTKYGVEHISQNEEIKQRVWETTKKHLTYNTSHAEEQIYNWLIDLGYNVEHHVKNNIYPYNCDFYISDYDLYIEYQGSYYHNGKAYLNTKEDIKELQQYKHECDILVQQGKNPKLLGIIDTWGNRDIIKRNYAYDHHINFLEIYSCVSKEHLDHQIKLWIACKYGYKLFTYIDEELQKDFDKCKLLHYTDNDFKNVNKLSTTIIKYFQENEFFKHEKEIYANNPILRRKLIQNRMKYLNKKEYELTVSDIIGGFKKSGIYYGYSHFNPEWTNWFINRFNIKTVYDPCGGWGHHLLGMLSCDKIIYNDINENTVSGIKNMKKYFNIDNLDIYNRDACKYIPEDVDAFFMCPPYYNVERYSKESEFSNIEEYTQFINRIFDIWDKNKASIFGIIIREDFESNFSKKWVEKIQINVNKSHFSKNKKYNEYFYIFRKENI